MTAYAGCRLVARRRKHRKHRKPEGMTREPVEPAERSGASDRHGWPRHGGHRPVRLDGCRVADPGLAGLAQADEALVSLAASRKASRRVLQPVARCGVAA